MARGVPNYAEAISPAVSGDVISRFREGFAVRDVNGDRKPDLVITETGDTDQPIQPDDTPITIMLGDDDYRFTQADTSDLPPAGWINDYVFLDSDEDGYVEIVAIDHGREIDYSSEYWESLPVYEYAQEKAAFVDRTDVTIGNEPGFYHNASASADLTGNGLKDFVVARLEEIPINIFEGNADSVMRDATQEILGDRYQALTDFDSQEYLRAGAAGILDYGGDGDYDAITLPYKFYPGETGQQEGHVFEFEDGELVDDFSQEVRSGSDFELGDDWGYSFLRTRDINDDGLMDVVALAENPEIAPAGEASFVSMLQRPEGGFTVSKAFPDQPLVTSREADTFLGSEWIDLKFSLEDLDGDGDPDLYWPDWTATESSSMEAGLYFNDGNGAFYRDPAKAQQITDQIDWPSGNQTRTWMEDINADGIGDFLAMSSEWSGGQDETTIRAFTSQTEIARAADEMAFSGNRARYRIDSEGNDFVVFDELGLKTPRLIPEGGIAHFQDQSLTLGNAAPPPSYQAMNAPFADAMTDDQDDIATVKAAYEQLLGYPDADKMADAQARIDYWVGQLRSDTVATRHFAAEFLHTAETERGHLISETTFSNNQKVVNELSKLESFDGIEDIAAVAVEHRLPDTASAASAIAPSEDTEDLLTLTGVDSGSLSSAGGREIDGAMA
ncbi:hypothetical protein SPISAL_07595 [Spiribacter salinus M19-40]|uniref:FG-GAP repeat-containing protein n=1 Tax=Spiribacter salinus M19-40 TaxID=1260251 RepID=R4VQ71_9GAMM|nr:VCBS repeat-containing protein [Spiribacter salinus]AGM41613.1 hypothetical protein SPISAL_07595 [Spiribacter salinus M19-40]